MGALAMGQHRDHARWQRTAVDGVLHRIRRRHERATVQPAHQLPRHAHPALRLRAPWQERARARTRCCCCWRRSGCVVGRSRALVCAQRNSYVDTIRGKEVRTTARTYSGQLRELTAGDLAMRIARALPVAALMLVFVGTGRSLRAQSSETDEIKRVIREETESYYRRDADAWMGTWVQDSTAIRTFITSGSYSVALGWDKFGPSTVEPIRKDSTPQAVRVDRSKYLVRIDGGLAWAEYDERTTWQTDSVPPLTARQQRTLVKRNGEWRILSAGSFVESTFGNSPGAVEQRLAGVGADLLVAKKHRDAIKVLALNAELFPGSAVAHQRLGEAYAATGETSLAVLSYDKSLAIDPKNDAVKAALAKLREKK